MATKYFYIDDDPKSQNKVDGFVNEELSIVAMQHSDSWEMQFSFLKENENKYDGLILDLSLNDVPNRNKQRASFMGTSLAQEIRTRQKQGELKSFPIVLYSAKDKIQQALENSGRDLFDIVIDKSKVNEKDFPIFRRQLIDLPNGYNALGDFSMSISKILEVDEKLIDSRFISEYNEVRKSPVHIQSRFLITEFLTKQGLLINEDVLAARLGIDKSQSEDWGNLLDKLTSSKYQGIYCKGWPRWWMHLVEQWWKETVKSDISLRTTQAKDRVDKIKQITQLQELVAAERIDKATSDEFWTICKGCNRPLDPVDGLLIQGQDNLFSWQEPEYVSVNAALWRKNIDNWISVADVEKETYEELKVLYSSKKK